MDVVAAAVGWVDEVTAAVAVGLQEVAGMFANLPLFTIAATIPFVPSLETSSDPTVPGTRRQTGNTPFANQFQCGDN